LKGASQAYAEAREKRFCRSKPCKATLLDKEKMEVP